MNSAFIMQHNLFSSANLIYGVVTNDTLKKRKEFKQSKESCLFEMSNVHFTVMIYCEKRNHAIIAGGQIHNKIAYNYETALLMSAG